MKILLILLILIIACASDSDQKFSLKIIRTPDQTYGYEIFETNKLLVRQTSIPGVSGVKGFRSKADAEKVARLVIEKLKQRQIPPTVTLKELRKLRIIH